jgi:hypothetical protein
MRSPARDIALAYLARGWMPIPVLPRSKQTILKRWTTVILTAEQIPPLFPDDYNVGIGLGKRSKGLADVDLDCQEAITLAPRYLPHTGAIFGRASRPSSHYLYYVTDAPEFGTSNYRDIGGQLLELRGNGAQTVMPGSIHEGGESIEWVRDGEPASVQYTQLLSACAQLAEACRKERGYSNTGTPTPYELLLQRCQDYVARCSSAVRGTRNDTAYSIAGHLWAFQEHGLRPDLADILGFMRQWNRRLAEPLDDRELEATTKSARDSGTPRPDKESSWQIGGTKTAVGEQSEESMLTNGPRKEPVRMRAIIEALYTLSGEWPRRIDNMLFVDDPIHGIRWFDRKGESGLFGWIKQHWSVVWCSGPAHVTQAELYAELQRTATKYLAVEVLPHEPMIDGIYYRCISPESGDGNHLRELLGRFRPMTQLDQDLILAAILTTFWGGPPGQRPLFAITSPDGRGAGKSKLAEMIGYLAGGTLDVSPHEDIANLKARFLSPEGQTRRIVVMDNVKSMKLSWAELEGLITSPTISGKRLYVGEAQRPNLLTWIITVNGISLGTDLAQRSVIIRIVRGDNDGAWYRDTVRFIDHHRDKLMADVVGYLRMPRATIAQYSRWATWEDEVLACLPEPSDLQRVIAERQVEANAEDDEADIIQSYIRSQLDRLGYGPADAVFLPSSIAAQWYCQATYDRTMSAAGAARKIVQLATEGRLQCLVPHRHYHRGRGFVFTAVDRDNIMTTTYFDIDDRLKM